MIIGLGHRRYVGKDSAANFLVSHLKTTKKNILIKKTGFASKMKAIIYDLYSWAGVRDEQYYEDNPQEKEKIIPVLGKSFRQLCIEVGNKIREIYNPTWIVYPFMTYKNYDVLIFKDMRFKIEAEEILTNGGRLIRIDNPRVEKWDDQAEVDLDNWKQWDAVITNDGSLAELNKKVISVITPLL